MSQNNKERNNNSVVVFGENAQAVNQDSSSSTKNVPSSSSIKETVQRHQGTVSKSIDLFDMKGGDLSSGKREKKEKKESNMLGPITNEKSNNKPI